MFSCADARYFQAKFTSINSHEFDVELLLLESYSGKDLPLDEKTDTILINIDKNSPIKYQSSANVKFYFKNINIEGEAKIGEITRIDRSGVSVEEVARIINEQETISLVIEYEDEVKEKIELVHRGGPVTNY